MNRICPSETLLSEYISGTASPADKASVERHLASCRKCRILLSEAHTVLSLTNRGKTLAGIRALLVRNIWALASAVCLGISFFSEKYFLQLLAASLIAGSIWIAETKNRKMLIMINEAWKRGDTESLSYILTKKQRS